jgi:D-serine deaminase-like pyridoxal phosphate-dependent protein
MQFEDPERPILLLDSARCKNNIKTMADKCRKSSCQFRPHFKTHQSIEIGRWFRDCGVNGITVSTPEMAAYFAEDGWDDITIGFPFYRFQLKSIKKLQESASLRLFIHDESDLIFLNSELDKPLSFYIELDNGYKRSGISPSDRSAIDSIIETAKSLNRVHFHGFYMHDGRTYQARSASDIHKIIEPDIQLMKQMKAAYPDAAISMGDTPSASALPSFEFLDECTAGNFVFYDWMQYKIGSCSLDDIALFHILPVAQAFPVENRAICHGGAVHCSKDYITDEDGSKNYGQLVFIDSNGSVKILDGKLESLSQEHGMLSLSTPWDKMNLNDRVCIVPVHSCLTANLYDRYHTTDGRIIKKRILS